MGRTFDETRAKAAVDDATRQAEHHIDDEPDPPRDRIGPHTTRIRSQRHDDPWAHPLPGGDA